MLANDFRRALAASAALALLAGPAIAGTTTYPAFADFVRGLGSAPASALLHAPGAQVRSVTELEAMQSHLATLYRGVQASHSFAIDGQVFDCVLRNTQPALKGAAPAEPPPFAPDAVLGAFHRPGPNAGAANATHAPDRPATIASQGGLDAMGHVQACGAGTVPFRRLTLEELSRFATLQDFFRKAPGEAGRPHGAAPSINGHSYAHEYQYVTNYGGYGTAALYSPYVNTGWSEVFSLSQHWYVGGSGSGLQTVEVGWQNYPAKYGNELSRLFLYYTADDYQHTGCYNNDCGAFVQTSTSVYPGASFTAYSTPGGAQYVISIGAYLYAGNWWVAYGNSWIGYYPGWRFAGGALTRNATEIDFGGETVGSWHWPAMGSGYFAGSAWPYAAYHRSLLYRDAANNGYYPSLTVSAAWPSCQTATPEAWGGSTWQEYFYFGGPGGYGC
jgi:hypothetical protein